MSMGLLEGEIFDAAFFVIFIALLFFVSADSFKVRLKNRKLNKEINRGILEYMILAKKYEDTVKDNDGSVIEKTEGFLKFVSESRDWAFQYIERVQIAIKNFQDIFHPFAIEYYKDKEKPVSQEEFGKLFEAYKKLIEELPDEGKSK
jgi:hypothetical protein